MAVGIICMRLIIQLHGRLTIPFPHTFLTPPQAGGPLQSVTAMLFPMTHCCGLRTLVGTPCWLLTLSAQLSLQGSAYQMCQRLQPPAAFQAMMQLRIIKIIINALAAWFWGCIICN